MDFIPACLLDADGVWNLSKDCIFGLAAKDIAGLIGLSLLGVFGWVRYSARKAGSAIAATWNTLTEHKDWPLYSNLAHQPAPKQFVGRKKKIAEIQNLLDRGAATVVQATITGAGGFGKTTLALEVARQSQSRFEGVWVVAAANPNALQNSFLDLASKLNIEDVSTRNRAAVVRDTFDFIMNSGEPWLLVYDNADDPHLLNDYQLAGDHKIRTLITSRSTQWDDETRISIDKLDPPEALELLQSLLPDRPPKDLQKLADRVGYWPLGLVGAAGFLKGQPNTTIDAYLTDFDTTKARLEASDYAKGHPEKLSFAAVLEMTTDRLSQDDKDLLSVLAFLNPDDLWPDGLQKGAISEWKQPFDGVPMPGFWQRAGEMSDLITQGFDRLAELSLIEQDDDTWAMHRMTGEIWRSVLAEDGIVWGDAAARLMNALAPYETRAPSNWQLYHRLMDQGRVLMQARVQSPASARFFGAIGTFALNRGAQSSDQAFAKESLEIREVLQPESESLAISLNNQARFFREFGDLDKALTIYERALEIQRKLDDIGPNHPSFAGTLNNIAGIHRAKNKFRKAVSLMQQALSIDENNLGPTHPETILRYRNLGALYSEWANMNPKNADLQDLRDKEAVAKQTALDRSLDNLGIFHQQTALDLNNSAIRLARTQIDKAFDLMLRAAVVRVEILGPDHPWTIGTLQSAFDLGLAQNTPAQTVNEKLMESYASLTDEHQRWGQAKLQRMMANAGIEGDLSHDTLDRLSNVLNKKAAKMRAKGDPIGACHWVTQEARYALNAVQFKPDPLAFHEKLLAAIENVKAQLTAAQTD